MTITRYIPRADGGFAKGYVDYSGIGTPKIRTNQPVKRGPYWYEVKEWKSTPALTKYMEPALLKKIDAYRTWSDRKAALDSWFYDPRSLRAIGYDHAKAKFLQQNPEPSKPTRKEYEIYEEAIRLYNAKAPATRVPKQPTADELAAEELKQQRIAAHKEAVEAVRKPKTEADLAVQLDDMIDKLGAYRDLCAEGGAYLLLSEFRDKITAIGAGLTNAQRRAAKELLGIDPNERAYMGGIRFQEDPVRLPLRAFDASHPIDEEMVAALATMMATSDDGHVAEHASQVLRGMLNWDREQVQGEGTLAAIEALMNAPTRRAPYAARTIFHGDKRYNGSRKSYDVSASVKLPAFVVEQLAYRLEHDEKVQKNGIHAFNLKMPNGGSQMTVSVRSSERGFTFTGSLQEWAGGNRFEHVKYSGGPITAEQLEAGADLQLRGPYKGGPVTFKPCRRR